MTYVNTHGVHLPLADLKAIDITGVRVDPGGPVVSKDYIASAVKHYQSFAQYWTIGQDSDPETTLRLYASLGIKDVGLFNEPDIPDFNEGHKPMSPVLYGRLYAKLSRLAKKLGVRLWGGCTSKYNPEWIAAAVESGMKGPIDFHGYGLTPEGILLAMHELEARYKVPVMCGETRGQDFKVLQDTMGARVYVWYDGPQGTNLPGVGLFDRASDGSWSVPTDAFKALKAALTATS